MSENRTRSFLFVMLFMNLSIVPHRAAAALLAARVPNPDHEPSSYFKAAHLQIAVSLDSLRTERSTRPRELEHGTHSESDRGCVQRVSSLPKSAASLFTKDSNH